MATESFELRGWLCVSCLYSLCFGLHLVLPPWTSSPGYACDCKTGKVLRYRCNGLAVLCTVLVLLAVAARKALIKPSELAICFWPALRAACTLGLVLSFGLFMQGRCNLSAGLVDRGESCLTVNGPRSPAASNTLEFAARSYLAHMYCGIEWNPRPVLGVDIKLFNYLVGAVALACNVLSAAALHIENRITKTPSNAMLAYLLLMLWFTTEYMYFEHVHLYTYDFFRERTGFKMCWGCFCWYPFFYPIGIWCLVEQSQEVDISPASLLICVLLFFLGWTLTRGANMQKFYWRTGQRGAFLCFRNDTVPGSRGHLLCTGFWGVARHVNYLGELVQAVALALPGWLATGSWTPWIYPLYYALLFVGREMDDDRACAAKYGAAWKAYCTMVPYRIVPGLY